MLSNNNNNLNNTSNYINSCNDNSNNNTNNNNSKRDLLTPFLSPEQLLFSEFEDGSGLENGDLLGDKDIQFGFGSNSLLFSSPVVPFSIDNDSPDLNDIVNELYSTNKKITNKYNDDSFNQPNNDIGIYDSNNIFQLPQPQQQDNSFAKSINSTSPQSINEPIPLYQPIPIPTATTSPLSVEQEKVMKAKEINKLIDDKHLLSQNSSNSISSAIPTPSSNINENQNHFPPLHKDRKPRVPPEYPIHQVNLLMKEGDNILLCKECDYKAKTRKSVQSHIRKAHTDKLFKIRKDCNEIFQAKVEDYSKDSIVCDHYGCGAIIVKYNKSKHYRQPHHIGHPKEIGECLRCKEVKQRTMMRNLKKQMKKNKSDQMDLSY